MSGIERRKSRYIAVWRTNRRIGSRGALPAFPRPISAEFLVSLVWLARSGGGAAAACGKV